MANPNLINVSSIVGGNLAFGLSDTLTTTLATVDSEKIMKINRIIVTNIHAADVGAVSLQLDGLGSGASGVTGGTTVTSMYLAKGMEVPAKASLVLLDTPIYLMEGDILKGGADAIGVLQLFISYEIIDDA